MPVRATSYLTHTANSLATGRATAQRLAESLGEPPALVVAYLTVNHDQAGFLRGVRQVLGPEIPVVGCSAQGVVGRGTVREEGYASGALAFGGGGIESAHGVVHDAVEDAEKSGRELGRQLRAGLGRPPKLAVVHYDALCGLDPERFLGGLSTELDCPILGGAAAHSFSYQALRETYQYFGEHVFTRAAVGYALAGDFEVDVGHCHGCSPAGVELIVTKARGNVLYELDGLRASDVWIEICGESTPVSSQSTALAIGVPKPGAPPGEYLVRAAYLIDTDAGSVALGPAIAEGTRIMLHHRTVEDVLDGTRAMGHRLLEQLAGKTPRAILGFECAARTRPFLGDEATLAENLELQRALGGDAPWLGMLPWGELVPVDGRPAFHNYAYSLVVLSE